MPNVRLEQIKTTLGIAASVVLIGLVLYLQKPGPVVDPQQLAHEASLSMNTLRLRNGVVQSDLMHVIIQEREHYIPMLIKQMSADEPDIKRLVRRAVEEMPVSMRGAFQLDQKPEVFRAGASWGLLLVLKGHNDFPRTVSPEESSILLPALRRSLKDQNMAVRLNAAACLSAFDPYSAEVKDLLLMALTDESKGVRYRAVYALWIRFFAEEKVTKFIDEALLLTNNAIRAETVQALKQIANPSDGGPFYFE